MKSAAHPAPKDVPQKNQERLDPPLAICPGHHEKQYPTKIIDS